MHILTKVMDEVKGGLTSKYSVFVDQRCWGIFQQSFEVKEANERYKSLENRKRQIIALRIMKKILNVHGKKDIIKFMGLLAYIEPKIQELRPYVRDHVAHALNTFLLGIYLIDKLTLPKINQQEEWYGYPFMWVLSGLTHDLGYPIEISSNISDPFVKKINEIIRINSSPSEEVTIDIYPDKATIFL